MENETIKSGRNFQSDVVHIDLRKWLAKLLSYWWLFLLCLAIAIPSGYMYLRYATFEYSSKAILLIKDAGRSGGISEERILSQGLEFYGGGKAMDNEIQILRSLTLMEKVIDTLRANVSYFRQGVIKERELYTSSPLVLDTFALPPERPFGASFLVEVKDKIKFILKANENDEGEVYYYNVPFSNRLGYFLLTTNPAESLIPGVYRIVVKPVESVAQSYSSKLKVERIGDQYSSSVLELKLRDPVPKKAEEVLNMLIEIYNEEEINDKNKVLRNTLDFIKERVAILTTELDVVEGGIESFKSKNAIITDDAASSMNFTLGEMRSSLQQISEYEVRKNILASIENFLTANLDKFELIPTNLVVDNPTLVGLVNQYNELLLQRDRLANTATEQNPARLSLERRLIDLRQLILRTVQNLQKDLQIPIEKIQSNIQELQKSMSTVPTVEKQLLEQLRTQTIKESLFLFLLQKREETALSEAITTASTRTIERARSTKIPVYPQRKLIYATSLMLGLFVPFLLIMIRSFFETKIESEEDLKQLTSIPILGRIAYNKSKENLVVKAGNRSAINEMFRLLRTNLSYLNLKEEKRILLVTSSIPGEGKSFIALNLAIALALSNKKVLLVGLDLRKPKLYQYLGVDNSVGLSNYLIGKSELPEIIQHYPTDKNLSYITSGPVPPNPAELILSDRIATLFQTLSDEYDYILIDTPPIGLVSDALLLRKYISNILVVVRHHYTPKVLLKNLEEMYQNKELSNPGIVMNGIKQRRGYYGYGYGYGGYNYGYGKGYYKSDDEET